MNRIFTRDRLMIFFIILIISSNIAVAKTIGVLEGNTLTISNESLINGTNYTVEYINDQKNIMKFLTTAENGSVEIVNLNLSSEIRITEVIVIDANKTPVTEKISIDNRKNPFNADAQAAVTPVPNNKDEKQSKSKSTEDTPKEESGGIILDSGMIFYIIPVLFIVALIALWYYKRLNTEEAKIVPELSISDQRFSLKVELKDESGARLSDKIVKAIAKNGTVPQDSSRSDIDGECTLKLSKGKYSIIVEGGEKFESVTKEINLNSDDKIQLILAGRQPLQIELVDESGTPLRGIEIRVLELPTYFDLVRQSPIETDNNGIAKFFISKNKQYVVSVRSLKDEFIKQEKIPINNSETTKKIQLIKRTGTLEVTVTEQATGKTLAGIPVTVTKKGTDLSTEFLTDDAGKINQKILVGDYIIRLKQSSYKLYESGEKYTAVSENRMSKIILDFRFNYQAKPQDLQMINTIREKLETSYKEVSAYDACIPLFFKRVGEKPTQLVKNIMDRPVEFLGAKTNPDEIISYILKTAEFITGEISRIMREKSNVDFYYSIQNLDPVNDLKLSDYSQDKFRELVRDIENYHQNHKTEIGNKLHEIDAELTQLSGELTIQPVADLWRVAQKLQENSLNESDLKKRGVMLFINDKLLDHVREMYTKDEVKSRLKFSMI